MLRICKITHRVLSMLEIYYHVLHLKHESNVVVSSL